jgi:hypothetical protein
MRRTRLVVVVIVIAIVAALAYLRDPTWLAGQTTGLRGWERADNGVMFRWSGGHASFFVTADAQSLRIPIATTFPDPHATPIAVTFSVDDVRTARVLLTDEGWRDVAILMPARGSRRVRRIDVRTSITREDNHGVKIGEVEIIRAPAQQQ